KKFLKLSCLIHMMVHPVRQVAFHRCQLALEHLPLLIDTAQDAVNDRTAHRFKLRGQRGNIT
ncbi:hypothetical protein AB0143_29550, partial [Klebsiella pneumoniae]